jgi:hypothetical protein
MRLYLKNNQWQKRNGGVVQVVEGLQVSKCKAVISNPQCCKKKKEKKKIL